MANYLRRLAALEERRGVNGCGPHLCAKCVIEQLPIVRRPGDDRLLDESTGCDGQPMTLVEILAGIEERR